jgi:hypothetical protein
MNQGLGIVILGDIDGLRLGIIEPVNREEQPILADDPAV